MEFRFVSFKLRPDVGHDEYIVLCNLGSRIPMGGLKLGIFTVYSCFG